MALEGPVPTSNGVWLPLVEYSLKSGVSLSTIRRKIKGNSIPYRLEKGKYLILFSGSESPVCSAELPRTDSYRNMAGTVISAIPTVSVPPPPRAEPEWTHAPVFERAVKMVSEAYESTIREKDERIRLLQSRGRDLEERVNELQLLVKVLEEKYAIEY